MLGWCLCSWNASAKYKLPNPLFDHEGVGREGFFVREPLDRGLTDLYVRISSTCFSVHQIITPFICHESLSKVFICQKEVWGYAKKERHVKLSKYQKKRKKMKHVKVPKYWKKEERNIAHTSKAINQKRENHDQRSTKNIRNRKIFHTLAHLDQSVWLASPWIRFLT